MPRPAFCRAKRNHGCEAPSHVVCIGFSNQEVNDNGDEGLGRAAAVSIRRKKTGWYGRSEANFDRGDDLWEWVRGRGRPRESTWVFVCGFHAAAIVSGLWNEFDTGRFRLGLPSRDYVDAEGVRRVVRPWHGLCVIEAKPCVVYAICLRGTVKIVDTNNYFDMSIDDLVDATDGAADVKRLRGFLPLPHGDLARCYAHAIELLMTRMIDSWSDGNRGNWQPTAGRLAMSNYMHEFGPEFGILVTDPRMDRKFHRQAYFGGRFQNWYQGWINGPLHRVDQCASFPFQMHRGLFPSEIRGHYDESTIVGQCQPPEPAASIAKVVVRGERDLPCRGDRHEALYPNGVFETTLAGPELAWAVERGRVQSWHGWTSFVLKPLFARYVDYWWAIREQSRQMGDVAGVMLAKLMMNCLYGKFGALKPNWVMTDQMKARERYGYWVSPRGDKPGWTMWRSIAGNVQKMQEREEKDDTFPAICAFVTSYQRLHRNEVFRSLPPRSVVLEQCDSFLLTDEGYECIKSSEYWNPYKLGGFRDVDTLYWADVAGPNTWIGNDVEVLSGVSRCRENVEYKKWRHWMPQTTADVIARGGSNEILRYKEHEFIMLRRANELTFGSDGWAVV